MPRLLRMDGLRGLLAVYVMLSHALPFTALPNLLTCWFSHGEAAVDLFFCLSGLVIMNSLDHHRTAGRFLRARALRLMPIYLVVLAIGTLGLLAGDPLPSMPWAGAAAGFIWPAGLPPHPLAHLAAHLTLIQGLIPQGVLPYAYVTLLGPAWSLSAEAQFYALVALVGLTRQRLLLAVLLALACLWAAAPPGGPLGMSRAFLPSEAVYFALGLASARAGRNGDARELAICLAAAVLLGGADGAWGKMIIPFVWAFILFLQKSRLGAVLESRALLFLGAVSYPLYLINEPVQRALALLIAPHIPPGGGALFTLIWLPLALALPILAAWQLSVIGRQPSVVSARLSVGRSTLN